MSYFTGLQRWVQNDRSDFRAEGPLSLQFGNHLIKYTFFGPSIHAGIDGMPVAEMLWQTSPLTPVLHHLQRGVEKIQIAHRYIAALTRQQIFDLLVLSWCEFHTR